MQSQGSPGLTCREMRDGQNDKRSHLSQDKLFLLCWSVLKMFLAWGQVLMRPADWPRGRSSIKGMTILEVPNCSVVCALP